ncbi:MAG: hypothetical protein U0359_03840 [Byssovorax sp.]
MRRYRLTASFYRAAQQHSPAGSPLNNALADTLAALQDESLPLPGPKDQEDLALPFRRFFTRAVRGTDLVLIYEIAGDVLVIHGVRLASW